VAGENLITQPVLHPVFLLLIFVPLAIIAVVALVRSKGTDRGMWLLRVALVIACFVLALRPGIPGGSTAQTLAANTDIVFVVDSTASIVAEDWNGNEPRLNGVREDISAIMTKYTGARFALITFDASAQLRLPFTTDSTALMTALNVLRPEVTSQSRGSSIGIAHRMLRGTLQNAADSKSDRSRMVFYFGDGEQTASSSPESFQASAELTDAGVVFGYGTDTGGPMRVTRITSSGQSEYIEYQGSRAMSVIDEQALRKIANDLGVGYQRRAAGVALDLPTAPTTTTTTTSGTVGSVTELYWIIAIVIMVLLAIELMRSAAMLARLGRLPRRGGAQ
jgi:Ca-activated chloride channel family protein